ncbi:MAG: hypothetical protein FWH02_09125 [Oscillospiraceae bacterium]|nr:hypothetical protein [Oscillospiraceae bacterium]
MIKDEITIGNATYNVKRQFDPGKTVREVILESVSPQRVHDVSVTAVVDAPYYYVSGSAAVK